ncbi:methyltransferase domain-containing protein [Teichococcus oryzae]|uniref:Methyltransferase domain-containing protein n=1 Tax=Teichococcus oryzae TaxID=1608942 RepID=A0A5B2TLQ9_9PROT|nr:methyltransferase domain-containing protein [Pseudoroseomonas oryzae]KAA2215139.1 methyltransferase domain-containing protein [Pseudoroseomonas oryzae]
MQNPQWDAEQYLCFGHERLRPVQDLITRIAHPGGQSVVDLGCGTGNALPLLAARFPGATVSGVDESPDMQAQARQEGIRVERDDIATWAPREPVDVLFSNAALHWLPDHAALFPRLLGFLAPGGTLAVQMPAMHDAPLRAEQDRIAREGPWRDRLSGITSAPPILTADEYYALLAPRVRVIDLWYTEYIHVLRGEDAVVQWASGSSLRPYLAALDAEARAGFRAAYGDAMREAYPPLADGTVLLPFRRFFILASL